MAIVTLSEETYQNLYALLQTACDVRVLKRAQALLWLSDGDEVEEIAERLYVSVRTIYRWVEYFKTRTDKPVAARVADAPRRGRPAPVSERLESLIQPLMAEPPPHSGYQAAVWTAPLLRKHLHRAHQLKASTRSISRVLNRLGLRWKRPRHSLARRSPSWCQAKGGLNVGWPRARGR